ncbi:hypothetical protein SAMN05660826_01764 [Caldanaerovirga acetigignens]|uniref:Uncharacterized protein n=1 Tax=Caldanaerovirga acetigignens TaxID=447595 RepID=A0A1M7L2B8_9FIRM|nr:hypothetical protein [Caldanaerovirga acetigignens]SHM72065.1 hypothetical protein SAMN05660826_01764 [Caldanaerovirga acetigignens]
MASKKIETCLDLISHYYKKYIEDNNWRDKEEIFYLIEIGNAIEKVAHKHGVTKPTIISQIEDVVRATNSQGDYKTLVYYIQDWLRTGNPVQIKDVLLKGASKTNKGFDEDLSAINLFFERRPVS